MKKLEISFIAQLGFKLNTSQSKAQDHDTTSYRSQQPLRIYFILLEYTLILTFY